MQKYTKNTRKQKTPNQPNQRTQERTNEERKMVEGRRKLNCRGARITAGNAVQQSRAAQKQIIKHQNGRPRKLKHYF